MVKEQSVAQALCNFWKKLREIVRGVAEKSKETGRSGDPLLILVYRLWTLLYTCV